MGKYIERMAENFGIRDIFRILLRRFLKVLKYRRQHFIFAIFNFKIIKLKIKYSGRFDKNATMLIAWPQTVWSFSNVIVVCSAQIFTIFEV